MPLQNVFKRLSPTMISSVYYSLKGCCLGPSLAVMQLAT